MQIDRLINILVSIVVIAGVPLFFVQQYYEYNRTRVGKTIDFAMLLQSADFKNARYNTLKPWLDQPLEAFQAAHPPEAIREKFVRDVVATNKEIFPALFEINEFFNSLGVCVESGACDADVADKQFGEFAKGIHCLYGIIYNDMKRKYLLDGFGQKIKYFAEKNGFCTQ